MPSSQCASRLRELNRHADEPAGYYQAAVHIEELLAREHDAAVVVSFRELHNAFEALPVGY